MDNILIGIGIDNDGGLYNNVQIGKIYKLKQSLHFAKMYKIVGHTGDHYKRRFKLLPNNKIIRILFNVQ